MYLPVPLREALANANQSHLTDEERKRLAELIEKMDAGAASDEERNEAIRLVTQRPRGGR